MEPLHRIGDAQPLENSVHRTIHAPADAIHDNRRLRFTDEVQIRLRSDTCLEIVQIGLHPVMEFRQPLKIDVLIVHCAERDGIATRLGSFENLLNFVDEPRCLFREILTSLIAEVLRGVFHADRVAGGDMFSAI